MNLVILEPGEVGADGNVRLTGVRAAHLQCVLGVAPGQVVRVGLLDGPSGAGTVQSVAAGVVELRCVFDHQIPPAPRVDLLLALPRPKVLRRLWAQLAALGAGRIMLTNAERVERNYFDTHVLTPACYRPLLIEGLQQARDTRLPLVSIHRQFKVLIEDRLDALVGPSVRLAADPAATQSIHAALQDRPGERVLLAVGPEGGWNTFELELLQAHGFQMAGMGPRALRSDTACIALLALAHEALVRQDGGLGREGALTDDESSSR